MAGETSSSRRSILAVDKSEEPFVKQLDEACTILGFDLDSQSNQYEGFMGDPQGLTSENGSNGPRYEWTLKWLLSNLRADVSPGSPNSLPDSWQFLRCLMVKVGSVKVAQIFTSHKYLDIVRRTLETLQKNTEGFAVFENKNGDSSSQDGSRSSKKRKLEVKESEVDKTNVISPSQLSSLILRICETLYQAQRLFESQPGNTQTVAEQFKRALRCTPGEAAKIIGHAFSLLESIFRKPAATHDKTADHEDKVYIYWDSDIADFYVDTYIDLWELQSPKGGVSSQSVFRSFTADCLWPTLFLLHRSQPTFTRTGWPLETSTGALRRLIATHVVEPIQNAPDSIAQDMFTELSQTLKEKAPASDYAGGQLPAKQNDLRIEDDSFLIADITSELYRIAITHTPRTTPKTRKDGDTFLRRFFEELKECIATYLGREASGTRFKKYSYALQLLLLETRKHDVKLNPAIIKSILEQTSGLFHDSGDQQIDWQLISFCIGINADVFTDTKGPDSSFPHQEPGAALKTLLQELKQSNNKGPSTESGELYSEKMTAIVIPLLKAFAAVRKLPEFFHHWEDQLSSIESAQAVLPSLWEDDYLLSVAQTRLERYLSADQIDSMFEKIRMHLVRLDLEEDQNLSIPNIVMLDCVVGGNYSEDMRARLFHQALSVYTSLATLLIDSSRISDRMRWRLWRILTTMNREWLSEDETRLEMGLLERMTEKAFTTINHQGDQIRGDGAPSFQEKSFAFNFITSMLPFEDISSESKGGIRSLFNTSVKHVLNLMEHRCHQFRGRPVDNPNPIDHLQNWNGRGVQIKSPDILHMSCVAQVLSRPTILGFVDHPVQKRMLEQLSLLAYDAGQVSEPPGLDISYSSLWKDAQRCEAVWEQQSFAEILQHLLCENFINFSRPEDPVHETLNSTTYTMVLDSLLESSLLQSSAGDMVRVADCALDTLRRWTDTSLASVSAHLQILVTLADAPRKVRKLMKIFRNILYVEDELMESSAIFELVEKVSQHASPEDLPACNNALCRLTYRILRHTFDSLESPASHRYFSMFYQWIGQELEQETATTPEDPYGWNRKSTLLLVTMTALNFYHENREQIVHALGSSDTVIDDIRKQHFERVIEISTRTEDEWDVDDHVVDLTAAVECLSGYIDLLLAHPDMLLVYTRLVTTMNYFRRIWLGSDEEDVDGSDELLTTFLKLVYKLPVFTNPGPALAFQIKWSCMVSRENETRVLRYFRDLVPNLDDAVSRMFLQTSGPPEYDRTFIIALTESQKEALHPLIVRRFLNLCRQVQEMQDWKEPTYSKKESFTKQVISLRYLNVVLRECPKQINQHMIETLLSAITINASKIDEGSLQLHTGAGNLFTSLCRVFSTIISLHRPKLGGRYHLTVPALQSLLRLLFVPYAPATPSKHFANTTFDVSHAKAYTRLLTSLCDPSPSAVTSAKPRQHINLHDETKRAKDVAGQHLPYLIMTYCESRIRGHFPADGMQEALEPGLWAVLGCISDESKRTMNAGMNARSRAVWKKLYEDWKKFGEWQAGRRP